MDFAPELESFGLCPFAKLTGKPCLFCGGTRAVVALGSGQFVNALQLNAFVVGITMLVALLLFVELIRLRRIGETFRRVQTILTEISIGRGGFFRAFWATLVFGWFWNVFRW